LGLEVSAYLPPIVHIGKLEGGFRGEANDVSVNAWLSRQGQPRFALLAQVLKYLLGFAVRVEGSSIFTGFPATRPHEAAGVVGRSDAAKELATGQLFLGKWFPLESQIPRRTQCGAQTMGEVPGGELRAGYDS
jgi:hypothetical protein